ncbi:hypothetical protein C2845_PM10G00970 [Panicum miliaceum]|uniref:Non-specific serine/threonine protein kinase n=1 Tax=Panicum miliaceum TaxID=4540 RepID=A0A3L6PDE9_PANMI|nr:hypothetical protein C2845_PM10G00970 [Panicum miliaceum]
MQRSQQQEGSSSTPPPSLGKRPRTAAAAAKPLPATLRGRYELHSLRGQGKSTEVWEARHLRTGHPVAIKIIILKGKGKALTINKAVEREVFVMRLLSLRQPQHPHIVRFYEAVRSGDHTYIVMELAESGQLYDHVAVRERLPEAPARRLFQQLVAAVAYCHRSMVVHRDLKMENVLLDSRGDVKIADFGFSELWAPGRLQTESCGSPQYAAPELLDGRLYVGPEVDVWSCGVILYGMLCGRLPFDGGTDDISDLRRNIRRGDFRLPSWVSDDARDLISSMLIVVPQKRATITEVRAHRWLQPDMPPYLAMLPTTSPALRRPAAVDAATVELLVTRHGFERASLLHHLDDDDDGSSGSEEAVSYQLVLSEQYDAATRYYQQLSIPPPPPPQPQWALGGGLDGVELLLHECPRETMRRIATALGQLGVSILLYHSHRHRMVCVVPPPGVSSASALGSLVLFEIQLLTASRGIEEQSQYAVHLRRTSGPQLPYLRVCSQLASKLRRPRMHQ